MIILVGIFASVGFSQTATAGFGTDFQLWNDTQFIIPLTKKKDWVIAIGIVGRVGNNLQKVTDGRIGAMVTKKVNKYVSFGGGYFYRYANTSFVRKRYESRYIGFATVTVPLANKFTLVNRNQLQYESRYSRPNAFVFRSRLLLKREVTIAKTKIEPFVSLEPFYDTLLRGISQYREQVGFSHKFSSQFSADFYYVRQDTTGNHTRPGTLNGIGTSFKINVR